MDIFSLAHYVSPIDQFIRMGKQAACPALTTQLTRIAAQKLALECLTRVEIVVPMPPKNSKNLRDHAYVIGETAAEVLRATLCPEFLNRDGMVAQKEKSQTERRKIKLKAGAGRFGEMGVNGLVLLVDDVVTSGATLFQAWNILGRPEAVALTLASTPLWSRH